MKKNIISEIMYSKNPYEMAWPFQYGNIQLKYGGNPIEPEECPFVWNKRVIDKCGFVTETEDCQPEGAIINYPVHLFCFFGYDNTIVFYSAFLLYILWLLYLFLILGTIADNFFCPSLSVIAAMLRLSDNIAGVTILAFGNGSPDIFTSLVTSEEQRLMTFTEFMGAGVFVTTVIAGFIAIVRPFRVQAKNFVRDVCFYIVAMIWISFIMSDHVVYVWEAFTAIGIYVAYIIVVVWMQYLESHQGKQKRLPKFQDPDVLLAFIANRRSEPGVQPQLPKRSRAFGVHVKLDVAMSREMNRERGLAGSDANVVPAPLDDLYPYAEEVSPSTSEPSSEPASESTRPQSLFGEFLYDISPINKGEWREAKGLMRFLMLIRVPFMILLQLGLPVVNETAEKRGWSKLLNCLQIVYTPVIMVFILEMNDVYVGPVPIVALIVSITSVVALVIFIFTSVKRIPRFHNALAILGFLTAMLVVFAVAREVLAILDVIGLVSGISKAMLGITLLAWGNCIGDLVSNTAIARKGFPRMGFSACFGGPMFNTLVGLGLTFSISALSAPYRHAHARMGELSPGCIAFLLLSLIGSLIFLTITGFVARRSYGFFLLTIYGAFLMVNVLSELHVIHPLGTDHRPDDDHQHDE